MLSTLTVPVLARVVLAGLAGALLVSADPAAAQTVSGYRDFALGSSVTAVTDVTRSSAADVTVVHQRPRLLQQLVWRPRYTRGGFEPYEAIREIQFQFLDGELYGLVVRYDAHEIEGLTVADLIAAISGVYGPPVTALAPAVAQWAPAGMRLSLFEGSYPSPYQLVIISPALEQVASTARLEAARLDRVEAPARAAAQRAEDAAQREGDDAAAREKNKKRFQP